MKGQEAAEQSCSEMGLRSFLQFFFILFFYHLLQLLPAVADDSSSLTLNSDTNAANHKSSKHSGGLIVLLLILGLLSVAGFSVFLFKIWQKKKRDAQQARLLKLFENDEDLEVELGIQD
ncbi:uncharacterized protein LOC113749281 [Coffea eugenioides]|uniref:Uncharacterized protein n=1 Tax=Coffea arabica TaxID=13443 RepID=A0A6P6UKC1_COFAR|nr:uncharacterized protein LOC113711749 [Coffea arabica]XP_027148767.1 uncharacterized protein LOC113749281 [Coffea eugenioides]